MLQAVRKTEELFNDAAGSPSAPRYSPESWNDLPIDAKENTRQFFATLRARHLGAATLLQSSSLFYLGALVTLCEPDEGYPNHNKSRILRLLPPDEVESIIELMKKHFSYQQTRANCYAYVLNYRDGIVGAKPDPGGKTQEFKRGLYSSYRDAIVAGAVEDGLEYAGRQMPPIRSEFYRAALFVKEANDDPSFHWVREDAGGQTWSHKDGHGPVKNTDYRGNIIVAPQNAALGDYKLQDYFYVPESGVIPTYQHAGL